ncbi:hypothetical protein M5362_20740 [Streptomyces sp. Je 1-79]|uniref:hypothetical protein n=1 Tax=Streptomyces sp. Je 1-79 TaxID=2943847 RepID=UPI0021A3D33D|nr:hypothetical protein [Streptomyces sp. Je 1-79]MCT4355568.1 hypothetical protein [Streptomyces sp. Je 1-79]
MSHIERPRRVVRSGEAETPGQVRRTGPARRLTTGPAGPVARPGTASGGQAARELYERRSDGLRGAVARLDAGLDESARGQLADWAREEYAGSHGAVPLGFVARCYLGPPYVDHILNLFHVIVQHFSPGEAMPEPFAKARMLARSDGYAYIEIYDNGLILPVLADGTVVRP